LDIVDVTLLAEPFRRISTALLSPSATWFSMSLKKLNS